MEEMRFTWRGRKGSSGEGDEGPTDHLETRPAKDSQGIAPTQLGWRDRGAWAKFLEVGPISSLVQVT